MLPHHIRCVLNPVTGKTRISGEVLRAQGFGFRYVPIGAVPGADVFTAVKGNPVTYLASFAAQWGGWGQVHPYLPINGNLCKSPVNSLLIMS